ncbi:hypothetical protein [Marinitoga sp. 1155]|uniref:hypothetical protein n=1 Tax=Marinitoga sp. 1155 TaxID=1428448 RepID=UPI00078D2904|nr:hypothetical protein [Marinitoga sp. 1155]AJW76972.2 hypothetical protein UF09_6 [Marinitoga camini virus 2]
MSRNALSSAVQELVNRNLITYKKGKKDHSVSKFWFPDLSNKKNITGSKNEPDNKPVIEPDAEPVSEPVVEPDREPIYKTKHKHKQNNKYIVPQQVEGPPPTPYQKLVELYHTYCPSLPKVRILTETRKKYLNARWKEHPDLKFWEEYFKSVEKSDFLTGRVDYGRRTPFLADFEWLIRPNNFAKVIEGKYKNYDEKEEKEEDYYITFPKE